jgi:hypothetical protein
MVVAGVAGEAKHSGVVDGSSFSHSHRGQGDFSQGKVPDSVISS